MGTDPTRRFSSRVDDYWRYRPGYPPGILFTLRAECGLSPLSRIADIGSGTGILTELFLENGNFVWAVEPNQEMRRAAERLLGRFPNVESVDGTAEATTLPDHSVDFITAGQAFHWFDRTAARAEFLRILTAEGWVVLVWNERETKSTPFARAYEELLERYGTDYRNVDHRRIDERVLSEFFGTTDFGIRAFPNQQVLDFEGLQGRLRSSSYVPGPGHSDHEPMLTKLEAIFREHSVDGRVVLEYQTRLYFGRLAPRKRDDRE